MELSSHVFICGDLVLFRHPHRFFYKLRLHCKVSDDGSGYASCDTINPVPSSYSITFESKLAPLENCDMRYYIFKFKFKYSRLVSGPWRVAEYVILPLSRCMR